MTKRVLVSYQILYTGEEEIKKEIASLLKRVFEDNYDEFSEEKIDSLISIKYDKQIDEYKFLVGFDLSFEEIGTELTDIIKDFNVELNSHPKISLVTKFYDENLFSDLSKIYEKLFVIEMKLREAISFIFIDTYKSEFYNLLRDSSIKPKESLPKDDDGKRDFLKKRLENEFFHILFNQYTSLSDTRDLKQEDLFHIAEMSNNFDEFKRNILNRGISRPDYRTFIEEIKPIMDKLEKIRNCVAHNRSLSSEDNDNYESYIEDIEGELNSFLEKIYFESKYEGPIKRLWNDGGGDEVPNNLRRLKFRKEVLDFYKSELQRESFDIERGITSYLRSSDGLWGLKFSEDNDKVSALLVDLKGMPREHQKRWHSHLIG